MNACPSALRWGKRTDPRRFAEFERHATHVIDGKFGCHERNPLLVTSATAVPSSSRRVTLVFNVPAGLRRGRPRYSALSVFFCKHDVSTRSVTAGSAGSGE